ncbi:hypothetical protein AC249_AIPGENE4183 [Exaiptasia diaphana]|nr:hypothetical protein AC249_AIPGENE4183 [Exaiptasia diaphana]
MNNKENIVNWKLRRHTALEISNICLCDDTHDTESADETDEGDDNTEEDDDTEGESDESTNSSDSTDADNESEILADVDKDNSVPNTAKEVAVKDKEAADKDEAVDKEPSEQTVVHNRPTRKRTKPSYLSNYVRGSSDYKAKVEKGKQLFCLSYDFHIRLCMYGADVHIEGANVLVEDSDVPIMWRRTFFMWRKKFKDLNLNRKEIVEGRILRFEPALCIA